MEKQEVYDMLTGCTILGTGGGGPLREGKYLIDKAALADKDFVLMDVTNIPDSDLLVTPYYCGSLGQGNLGYKEKELINMVDGEEAIKAVKTLEETLNCHIAGVIPTELGGSNTAIAFYVGAMLDKYIVNGDPVGRAVPGLQHSTYHINNIPIAPLSVVDKRGNTAIFTTVKNDFEAEKLIRALSVASNNILAVADHLTTGEKIKKSLIPDTITYAQNIGKMYRLAKDNKKDIALEVAKAGYGKVVFRGLVRNCVWKEEKGFTYGEVYIKGVKGYKGSNFKIWIQNENIITWLNGNIYATVPELICVLDERTGDPVTTPNYSVGTQLSIIVLPAPNEWLCEDGIKILGPRAFGFDLDFRSVLK